MERMEVEKSKTASNKGQKGSKAGRSVVKPVKSAVVKSNASKTGVAKANVKGAKVQAAGDAKNEGTVQTRKRIKWGALLAALIMLGISAVSIIVAVWAVCTNDALRFPKEAPEWAGISIDVPELPKKKEPVVNTDPLVPEPANIDPATYKVADYKPRYISFPSIGLNKLPVTEIDLMSATLGTPKSNDVVGWYYRSAIPGEEGAAFLDGHGGDLGVGILKTLPRVKEGDEIIVEMGDGRKFTYVVKEMAYRIVGSPADAYLQNYALQPIDEETPTLTILTCTGNWIREQQMYDQRLFVRAALREE